MRVFVSYSFIDKELYLLTLLVSKLREKGNTVQLSDNNYLSKNYINNSELFLGLITNHSDSINNVFNEWQIAEKLGKQRILLVEEGVNVYRNDIEFIRFNRNNPQLAIQQLFKENEDKPVRKPNVIEDIVTAGAVIAGIAALLSLLDSGNKKK
ncbi:toll/interleukin-1 receptor domain-containing protein [Flavobacterium sediminilitoris]|uniref:Toll/interleukin-1 receptor domain-containing protein n=1 Tax=Flavobacterium sediminilitoris TaxID=2024526 RepID=A0ABY4HM93_9FLAO|nr:MULTISPECIES: toll/interleukin-1 receptor domain-containing protein [Flavobacterium]UOX32944.1 toll/interleukin-1 receptor domain-containing protein [Flavobacterium sediminilitoris]